VATAEGTTAGISTPAGAEHHEDYLRYLQECGVLSHEKRRMNKAPCRGRKEVLYAPDL